ncbi:LacI family DNA-binding transcriptional regulator [Fulvivirga sediminis]|uniref:LacI family DNA-binding transcriptional regulator n=1 Tax=Fulvivirga sediminis TaxID=2803949 RepID=A0A937F6H5_9BACT|nr:LacI family DNA-binding transcriptional regulator [Fulvivirga sediminis]MBL3656645.1 LacI family DNA-binding transcriptional regulator [Fulvivirga sediminis]
MGVTLKDIAFTLGLSPSTVSRALNDHPDINEQTRKSVKQLAKKMNYQVNKMASGLRTRKTYAIGVIVPKIASHFFSSVLSGIQKVAGSNDYQVYICQTNESTKQEIKYISSLMAGSVDGILVSLAKGSKNLKHIKQIIDGDMPLVLFDRTSDQFKVPKIEAEDFKGAYRAVTHLIEIGCKKIAHLAGPDNLGASHNRLLGYKQALIDNKIPIDEKLIIPCDFDPEKGREAVRNLISGPIDIDGIFSVNDEIGVEVILALQAMGINVPQQVAVVGFGDFPICEIVMPHLSSVMHNPYRIGYEAAECLFDQINSSQKGKNFRHIIPSQLVIRESSRRS